MLPMRLGKAVRPSHSPCKMPELLTAVQRPFIGVVSRVARPSFYSVNAALSTDRVVTYNYVMNTKTILIVIAVIIVAALGYYAYTMQSATPTTSTGTPAPGTPYLPPGEESSGAQGKLDINVVCEGALAYMTFPDGAAAEKFVAECKAGDHPEVIEKYRADMNLGTGVSI